MRAQAAIEFVMSYGWAILAAVMAAGALAYFGVFHYTTPTMCLAPTGFVCTEYAAIDNDSDETLSTQMSVKNVIGETVILKAINITKIKTKGKGIVKGRGRGRRSTLIVPICNTTPPLNSAIKNDAVFIVNCIFGPADNPGEGAYVTVDANFTYQREQFPSPKIGTLTMTSDVR
jgi:hypothetical protein